jgi:hypothetical protein
MKALVIQYHINTDLDRGSQTVGGGGALLVTWEGGMSCLYKGHTYFESNVCTEQSIYILIGTLLG